MEKENKENICVVEFFNLLGLFVVNRTANSPNKSCVLCKYITTVRFCFEHLTIYTKVLQTMKTGSTKPPHCHIIHSTGIKTR